MRPCWQWQPSLTVHDPKPPLNLETPAGGFPAQFFGLKIMKTGSVIDLCLVAEADAPAGMGGVIKFRKDTTTYAIYLVETGDANASPLRIRTTTGTKAARLKT